MKHTINYILSVFALLISVFAQAQTATTDPPIWTGYKLDRGIATKKTVDPIGNNRYTVKLEAFATGQQDLVVTKTPLDIVLVLDVSGSMDYSKGTPDRVNSFVTYDDVLNGNQTYFVLTGGEYQRVYARTETRTEWENQGSSWWPNWVEVERTYYQLYRYLANPQMIVENTDRSQCRSNQLYTGTTRMQELQKAVGAFIDQIDQKDQNSDESRVGHQISIIKFASDSSDDIGNDTYYSNPYTLNYSQIVKNLTRVEGNVDALKGVVNGFQSMGGTQAGYGMNHANTVLANARADANKVVVFFTDGAPDDSYAAIGSSNNGGTNAYKAKNTYDATVYTIGMFTTSPSSDSDTYKYLNYVSSNYPKATVNNGTMSSGNESYEGYYKDASGNIDLTKIFEEIAGGIGDAAVKATSATKVVDGVSSSFKLPDNYSASDASLKVYSRYVVETGAYGDENYANNWSSASPLTKVVLTSDPTSGNQLPPATAEYMTDESKVGVYLNNTTKELTVLGFNYSKSDSPGANGTTGNPFDGNWVGWRYNTAGKPVCVGKELVIEFEIEVEPNVTGGDATQTNTERSAVYVPVYDDDGNFTGYEAYNSYTIPDEDLPVNIVITKKGMKHGESATIQIYWAPQSTEYNTATGKLKPDLTTPWAGNGNKPGWGNFSKVILTNKGADNADVTETLTCLDPGYVYLLEEDNWGWSYQLDTKKVNTSEQVKNPFIFTNTKITTGIVKHAESASFNRFGGTGDSVHGRPRIETVKSKEKIESPANN